MPEEKEKTEKPITNEIATTSKDINIFSGWIKRLENPDPTLSTESQGKGLKLYDEVDRDPHAGAVLQSRYLAVVGKEWEVIPGAGPSIKGRPSTVTRAQKIADFVKKTLKGINFDQFRQELLQGILYGFYVGEVMWQVKDGSIVPEKILAKHPRRFSFTMDRDLRLLTTDNMIEGEEVPNRKFIVFTYGSSDNPYGKGLGQKLWWPVWFKKNGIKFWLVFLEKFGMPTAVGKYPSGTDKGPQQDLLDAIDAIQTETGVKIPDSMAIELLEASRTGKVTYETLCEYMDKQVSKAVLGQTATTEGTPGKLGEEKGQTETKQDVLEADAGLLDECLNNTLIRWLVDYNFSGVTEYPKLQTRTAAKEDLKALSERDKTLTKEIRLPVTKRYFYETYAIPEPEEGDEIVEPQSAGTTVPGIGNEFAEKKAKLSPGSDLSPGTVLDKLGEKALTQADFGGLMGPVEELLASVSTLEEFRDGLLDLYGDMDASSLGNLMQQALVLADLSGRFDVTER